MFEVCNLLLRDQMRYINFDSVPFAIVDTNTTDGNDN